MTRMSQHSPPDLAQVARDRLLLQQELEADGLDLPLQLVDAVPLLPRTAGILGAAGQQRLHGGGDNALAFAAHFRHFPVQQAELLVKSASHIITQTFL